MLTWCSWLLLWCSWLLVWNDGTGDETSDARRARRRDEKRGQDFAVKIVNFTRPFLDSEN